MEDKRLQELIAERRNILANFLRADLKLGMTFAQVAQTEAADGNRADASAALHYAAKAVAAVERFLSGVNEQDRTQIESDLAKLKDRLAELEGEGT